MKIQRKSLNRMVVFDNSIREFFLIFSIFFLLVLVIPAVMLSFWPGHFTSYWDGVFNFVFRPYVSVFLMWCMIIGLLAIQTSTRTEIDRRSKTFIAEDFRWFTHTQTWDKSDPVKYVLVTRPLGIFTSGPWLVTDSGKWSVAVSFHWKSTPINTASEIAEYLQVPLHTSAIQGRRK